MPVPVPVPAPPPLPLPCEGTDGNPVSAPGISCTPAEVVTAGMLSWGAGLGSSFFGGSGVSVGGLATGTVIFSLPGSSAFFGGSGDLLPPPPPPPPGPGEFSQMMSVGITSRGATLGAGIRHVRDDEEEEQKAGDVRADRNRKAAAQARLLALEMRQVPGEKLRIRVCARFRYFGHVLGGERD